MPLLFNTLDCESVLKSLMREIKKNLTIIIKLCINIKLILLLLFHLQL